ncbi:MAG TPA: lysylphosphatidylglycerol synthase transmembrane domain-containing protein [Vicinamibacteria bacterium]|nr:lysylphosphatidylglycerol synthase transmembrane domain-containing protein [Vicinamibacteria bacterium]
MIFEEPAPPAESPWHQRLRIVVAAAILVAAVAWAAHGVDFAALRRALAGTRPGWLAAAAVVNLLAVGFQAARWLALVRPLGREVTFGSAFKALVVGNAVSVVVPARAGELARLQWLARRTGLPRASILGSIGLDLLVNAVTLGVGLLLASWILPVPAWLRRTVLVAGALVVVAVVGLRALPPASDAPLVEPRSPVWRRLWNLLARARHGLSATGDPRALAGSLLASSASWMVEIVVVLFAFEAMGFHLPWPAAVAVLIGVNVALAMPFAPPGNAGTLEAGATVGLVSFGVPKEQALAFALLYHLLQIVPIGILGAVFAGRAIAPSPPADPSAG